MSNSFNSYDFLNPMNRSTYLESYIPGSIDEAIDMAYNPNYVPPKGFNGTTSPNNAESPKLRPQPTKDSWYYSNDGADDGKISGFEKLKAFVKGGTYNMVRGMFCDKDGFSISRTLMSAAVIAAIAVTGPIGAAVAGGVGLIAAGVNFAKSVHNARHATTDQQAREAYEGFGESATTAGLSLWGGLKGLKALKTNFGIKGEISIRERLTQWHIKGKAPVQEEPINNPPQEEPVENIPPETDPPIVEEPIAETEPFVWNEQKALPAPKEQLALPESNERLTLPEPNSRPALPEPNEQLALPYMESQPEWNLGPIENYYRTPESQFNIPERYLRVPTGEEPVVVKGAPKNTRSSKVQLTDESRNILRQRLGKNGYNDEVISYERHATKARMNMLPEIFQYIKEFRAASKASARAANNGKLPKGYKDTVEYRDAIDLYKLVKNSNKDYVRSLLKEGKYSLDEIIRLVKKADAKAKIVRKYGEPKPLNIDVRTVSTNPGAKNYTSGTEPVGKVPPTYKKTIPFPESYPTGL